MHHGRGLRRELIASGVARSDADRLVEQLARGPEDAELSHKHRRMLDYVLKLNRQPAEITADDVQQLRRVGYDDLAIHDICCVAAYYAFVNRVANGLGVELETP